MEEPVGGHVPALHAQAAVDLPRLNRVEGDADGSGQEAPARLLEGGGRLDPGGTLLYELCHATEYSDSIA